MCLIITFCLVMCFWDCLKHKISGRDCSYWGWFPRWGQSQCSFLRRNFSFTSHSSVKSSSVPIRQIDFLDKVTVRCNSSIFLSNFTSSNVWFRLKISFDCSWEHRVLQYMSKYLAKVSERSCQSATVVPCKFNRHHGRSWAFEKFVTELL